MATAGLYYIDTFNFADATAVYTDAALTTFAPDGFYQMGGETAREQVSGVLKPAEPCPSCVKPSPDPTPTPVVSFKAIDIVTSAVDYVVVDANYNLQTEVTTDISANCWLLQEYSATPTTNTITGLCAPIPPDQPVYYELRLCPASSTTGAPDSIYTSIVPTLTQKRYLYTIYAAYYLYENAQPVATPLPGIPLIETGLQLEAQATCPAPVTLYNYWNTQSCNNPGSLRVFRGPLNKPGLEVGEAVKHTTSSGAVTCYEITGARIGQDTSYDLEFLGSDTIYSGCTTGASPCIVAAPTNTSFLARENTPPNAEYHVLFNSSFKVNDNVEIQTSGGVQIAGCYKLVSQSTTPTTNTIINDCPDVAACYVYDVSGVGTWQRCTDGAVQSYDFSLIPDAQVCARLGTPSFSGGQTQGGACFQDIPIDPPGTTFDYFNAQLCDGTGGTISVKTDGVRPTVGQAVKINSGSTCYKITSTGGSTLATDVITNISNNCNQCNPPVSCYAHSVEYSSSATVCPTGQSGTFGVTFADTNDFATATKLFSSDGCVSSSPANIGTYAVTTAGTKISRYWDGTTLGSATVCSTTPQQITATITTIDNKIQGTALGVGYKLTGSGLNSATTGASPLAIPSGGNAPFNTDVSVNPGFSITGKSITYSPTSITQNSSVTVTIEGTISADTPSNVYSVKTCGNQQFYVVDSGSQTLSNGAVIRIQPDNGMPAKCATVLSPSSYPTKNADFIDIITNNGCDNIVCISAGFDGGGLF